MKLVITACVLVAITFLPSIAPDSCRAVADEPAGKRVSLLVGVNKYDKRLFNDLSYAERDVEEMAAVLEKGGYEVQLLTGSASGNKRATLKNIGAAVETLLKERTKRDLVLIGLAGHGLQVEVVGDGDKRQAESFFCPVDAEADNAKTMLSIGQLFEEINRRGGGRNLVLVDACREDPTRGRGMDGSTVKTLPEGVAVLFGCAAGQKTYETEKAGGGHGVFFHTVLEGLRGGAKKNDAGDVTWSSLVDYATENVETDLERFVGKTPLPQTPNLVTNLRGRSPIILPRLADSFAGSKAGQERSDNGLKMKFCWCPAGRFTMGSPKEERLSRDDEEQVSVTISRGFWLGKYEVTQGEWEKIMGSTIREQRDKLDPKELLRGEGASFPMYYVNHEEATEFCRKLTNQERRAARLPADWEYRLPTEAQWEYACRAGGKSQFTFGDDESELEQYAWKDKNSDGNTHEVGGKRANAWKLHDMHGNVWEWCRDWYDKALLGGIDPEVTKKASDRALRGGCWSSNGFLCRCASRNQFDPKSRGGYNDVGFRVAVVQSSK